MSTNDYLRKVLAKQAFGDNDPEMKELKKRRKDVEDALRECFSDCPISIRWAGAIMKGTMIRESYDGDLTCYFNNGDDRAGATLEEIYNNVADCLEAQYLVDRSKASALRVKDRTFRTDLHIDVVPGRFTDDEKADVYLHRTTGEKERLKTNLDKHIEHISKSGVIDAIRLMKLWKVRHNLQEAKTFVLELLVVKHLGGKKSLPLEQQIVQMFEILRDKAAELTVEDPANPYGNDLTAILDQCRFRLSIAAGDALFHIANGDWEAVFGTVDPESDKQSQRDALLSAVPSVKIPTKPWLPS